MKSGYSLILVFLLVLIPVIFVSGCTDAGLAGCSETSGDMHLCGYCAEDRALSSNPNAGQCRYCKDGYDCSYSDICGDLRCTRSGTSGGGGGGGGGTTNYWVSCSGCQSGQRSIYYNGPSYQTCREYWNACYQNSCTDKKSNC